MEWNCDGNGMDISPQNKSMQNGMEMERKWDGLGMEIYEHSTAELKLNVMEQIRYINLMERVWQTVILIPVNGNRMAWKWRW